MECNFARLNYGNNFSSAVRPTGSVLIRGSNIEAGDGHEGGGHGLVAAAEGDDGVGKVSLVHDLDAVGDGVPGDEGVPHGLGAVRQTVAEERDIFQIICSTF